MKPLGFGQRLKAIEVRIGRFEFIRFLRSTKRDGVHTCFTRGGDTDMRVFDGDAALRINAQALRGFGIYVRKRLCARGILAADDLVEKLAPSERGNRAVDRITGCGRRHSSHKSRAARFSYKCVRTGTRRWSYRELLPYAPVDLHAEFLQARLRDRAACCEVRRFLGGHSIKTWPVFAPHGRNQLRQNAKIGVRTVDEHTVEVEYERIENSHGRVTGFCVMVIAR